MIGDSVREDDGTGGNSQRTSSQWLDEFRMGDPAAWNQFVRMYGPLVYGWCRMRGLAAADAADVGQYVFLAVYNHIANFRKEKPGDTFRGWLRRITQNKINDFFRGQSPVAAEGGSEALHELHNLPGGEDENTESALTPRDGVNLAERILEWLKGQRLKPNTLQAFLLVKVENRNPADVAQELGMPLSGVYLAVSRVLKRLRDYWGDFLDL